jgi:hypothetical protein
MTQKIFVISKMKIISKFNNITQVIYKKLHSDSPNTNPWGTPEITTKGDTRAP